MLSSPASKLVHLCLAVHLCPRALEGGPLLTADVVRGLGLEGLGPQHVLRGVSMCGVEGVILLAVPGGGHDDVTRHTSWQSGSLDNLLCSLESKLDIPHYYK